MDYADDDEIRAGIRLLAETTGIFAETAGGTTVAVLKKLIESGKLDPEKETVVYNTGEGLKTLDAVAELVGPTHRIKPSLRGAREAGLLG
jgi:threonine synthase